MRSCPIKWFKHDSDAGNDAKLRKLRLKYGAQGYGVYWYCLELIARNVEKHNLTFELEHDAELIADDFKLSSDFVQDMMTFMVNLGLFENTCGVVTCLKMSTRTDEYTQKLLTKIKNNPDSVPTINGESPRKSELREEKRREEKIVAKKSDDLVLPDFIDKTIWIDFKAMRKKIKKPMTDRAELIMLKKLTAYNEKNINVNEVLENSILNGWQDVYEPKNKNEQEREKWKDKML